MIRKREIGEHDLDMHRRGERDLGLEPNGHLLEDHLDGQLVDEGVVEDQRRQVERLTFEQGGVGQEPAPAVGVLDRGREPPLGLDGERRNLGVHPNAWGGGVPQLAQEVQREAGVSCDERLTRMTEDRTRAAHEVELLSCGVGRRVEALRPTVEPAQRAVVHSPGGPVDLAIRLCQRRHGPQVVR